MVKLGHQLKKEEYKNNIIKKKHMPALPVVSFKEFVKNPIVALLFICLMAIGYLYVDNRTTLTNQITHLQEDIEQLESDYKELNYKFIETLQKIETK
jgi:hypothetical protein